MFQNWLQNCSQDAPDYVTNYYLCTYTRVHGEHLQRNRDMCQQWLFLTLGVRVIGVFFG